MLPRFSPNETFAKCYCVPTVSEEQDCGEILSDNGNFSVKDSVSVFDAGRDRCQVYYPTDSSDAFVTVSVTWAAETFWNTTKKS